MRVFLHLAALFAGALAASAQAVPGTQPSPGTLTPGGGYRLVEPRTPPYVSPAQLTLLAEESRFQQAVAEGGGPAFASFFAEDGVVLSNGKPVVQGRSNIAAQAQWDAKTYQLSWTPDGAQMGPGGDMGFTWGHYDGRAISPTASGARKSATSSGRYMTVWKKVDGAWKVAMEASADDAAAASTDCCTVPHP